MKWLLLIWNRVLENPNDEQYKIINDTEIQIKLQNEKYIKFFEALLMWSGFDRDQSDDDDSWIYNIDLQERTIWLKAIWSVIITNWKESKIQELMNEDEDTTKEEAEWILEASLKNENEEEQEALIRELVNDGYSVKEALLAMDLSNMDKMDGQLLF